MTDHSTITAFPTIARQPSDARTFGLDDFRRNQLIRTDDYSLRSCARWGDLNAHWSDETIFAENCLANRAVAA